MQILWFCAPVLAMATEADSMPGTTWDGGFVQGEFLNGWHLGVRGLWSPTQEEAFRLEWQISRER